MSFTDGMNCIRHSWKQSDYLHLIMLQKLIKMLMT